MPRMTRAGDPTNGGDPGLHERIDDENRPDVLPEKLAIFERYWQSTCHPDHGVPRRRDFQLERIGSLLANLAILDIEAGAGGTQRYRFRLAGTWHLENFGVELTGRYIDELRHGDPLDQINRSYETIARNRELHYWRRRSIIEGREYMTYTRLMGPLSDDGGKIVQFVGCFVRD